MEFFEIRFTVILFVTKYVSTKDNFINRMTESSKWSLRDNITWVRRSAK